MQQKDKNNIHQRNRNAQKSFCIFFPIDLEFQLHSSFQLEIFHFTATWKLNHTRYFITN